jgi:hypothetical protein
MSPQTFADESFKIGDPRGVIVLGQLPQWVELRWHPELLMRCGPELKWGKVRHHWPTLSHDLRREVLRDLRDALITIEDRSLERLELEQVVVDAVGKPSTAWPSSFRAWFDSRAADYERNSILLDSPVQRIQDFLEDDGEILGDIGGVPGNTDESRSILSELEQTLSKPHTMRLFGARSAAAFVSLLSRDELEPAIAELWDVRYVTPGRLFAHVLASADRMQHVFDEGNRPSVWAIVDLRDRIRQRLAARGQIVLTDDMPDGAIELKSTDTPMLQAADLAGGYARSVYIDLGLRVVCEEFKGVVFNGSMVRDWSQIERSNLTELRERQ